MTINERLAAIRQQMKIHNLDAYIMPSSDPHQSEYPAAHWKSRAWISGFTGSMGYVCITQSVAQVWTDGRYFLQCEQEIKGSAFELRKQVLQGAPEHVDWLATNLPAHSRVGCDGTLFSVNQVRSMQSAFVRKNMDLVTDADLITPIWQDRPSLPKTAIFEHEVAFAGKTRLEKLNEIRSKMTAQGADCHLVTTLDDIGWTLNLRGSDVECNPVFVAHLVIGLDRCDLFIDAAKVPADIKAALNSDGIIIRPYELLKDHLAGLTEQQTIIVDPNNANFYLFSQLRRAKVIEMETFSILMKAIKNETEQRLIHDVMVKDGVALTKAFMWLEKTLTQRTVTEYEMASMIAQYRSDQPHYFGESFDAIVGYNGNGAIIHYHPDPHHSAVIEPKGILLLDSGGQYADGTTDITRTISLDGNPTAEQRRNYTSVLRGHIAIAQLRFPEGTKGIQMDILARQFLWQDTLNYGHGTGHGVGFFMNVHEPPQGIAGAINARGTTPHKIGMLTSNEPGFYKEGEYGIRIENLILVANDEKTPYGQFYKFDTVTLFPIDTQLVDASLMSKSEIDWLNAYHERVYEQLSVHLDDTEKAWMKEKCRAV
ncbi:MAG: aminopeptidase P family protein [Saprospiraceae bacterium]|nr:aminopeptidase P family protein [Saprospiraceae bacterium]